MSEKFDYLSKEIKQAEEKATNLINAVAKCKFKLFQTSLITLMTMVIIIIIIIIIIML